ncbi:MULTISPECIES: hypothetical protein [unclassified Streptomyces]|uniref:hypothetical protein n=2 Tax=Streptomyces TaxID=1883 RepID=UPI00386977BF
MDRLDPDPQRSSWVRPFMLLPAAAPALDRPAELRAWYEDRESRRAAHAHIRSGAPLLLVVPVADCAYTLSVRPVRATEPRPPCRPLSGTDEEGIRAAVPGSE